MLNGSLSTRAGPGVSQTKNKSGEVKVISKSNPDMNRSAEQAMV